MRTKSINPITPLYMAIMSAILLFAQPAAAMSLIDNPKYAAIVIDADTDEVLYARNADAARHPASITKVMTLYLAFQELEAGDLGLTDRVYFSRHAASQPPSKLGIGQGGWITVEQAIRLLTTKSANDVAVALAEHIEKTEVAFAQRMTEQARELGMMSSAFYNASGLPNPAHSTTARDLAKLSEAIIIDFPQYYAFFSQQQYNFMGKTYPNHNRLLGKVVGLDGIKTGFTNASGFTLAASAQRGGHRLIAIVLGAPSSSALNANMAALINSGFDVLKSRRIGQSYTIASQMAEPESALDLWGAVTEQGSTDDAVWRPRSSVETWLRPYEPMVEQGSAEGLSTAIPGTLAIWKPAQRSAATEAGFTGIARVAHLFTERLR